MSDKTNLPTDGSCIISEEVIATIAGNAALEVEGVAALAQRPINVRGVMATGASRSVGVISNPNETVLDMYIQTTLTAHIPTLAEEVQKSVKSAVQSMTGSPVTKVNIYVVGVAQEPQTTEETDD